MKLSFPLTILLLILQGAASFSRGATVSLPLGGVYRAGRYMPVQITADSEYGNIVS